MRLLKISVLFGLLLSFAFAQEGAYTLDVVALRMPADVGVHFQRRIQDGGKTADEAMSRLSEMVQAKKITELDRWHQEVGDDPVEHFIPFGGKIVTEIEAPRDAGMTLKMSFNRPYDSYLMTIFGVDTREKMVADSDHYLYKQSLSSCCFSDNQWFILKNEAVSSGQEILVAKVHSVQKLQEPSKNQISQSRLQFQLCTIEGEMPAFDRKGRLIGKAAEECLKSGNVMIASDQAIADGQTSFISSSKRTVHDEYVKREERYYFHTSALFSEDQKIGEFGFYLDFEITAKGGKRWEAKYQNWVDLPLGEQILLEIPTPQNSRNEKLVLAVRIPNQILLPATPSEDGDRSVHPSIRRLLAEAAGLPVPKPELNASSASELPEIKVSLEKLGFPLESGEMLLHGTGSRLQLTGKRGDQLRAFVKKYLPLPSQLTQ